MALELDEEDLALLGYGEVHDAAEDFVFEKSLREKVAAKQRAQEPWAKLLAAKVKRQHYEFNKGRIQERAKEWQKSNPEKVAAIKRRYYERTKEQFAARSKAWAKANPEKRAEINKRYYEKRKACEKDQ